MIQDGAGRNGHLRIGELARRTAVSPEVLRAWERRYGLLSPSRSPSGYRLYTDADERRVRLMRRHVDCGVAPAEAARLALDDAPAPGGAPAPGTLAEARDDLGEALESYREVQAQAVLDRLLAAFSVEAVVEEVVLPHLREIGERWHRGEISVGQEHFATGVLRSRLLGLARGWDEGFGPRAVLCCPPEERHDTALIAFGIALRAQGWRITYLGADTPVATVAETSRALEPVAVVLSAATPERLAHAADELGELARTTPLTLAGPGATAELAARLGAGLLTGTPFAAARELTVRTRAGAPRRGG